MKRLFRLGSALVVVLAGTLAIAASAGAVTTPLGQFGADGTDAGELQAPNDITLDPATGNLYVAEGGNNRISVFSPSGQFLRAFGGEVIDGTAVFQVCTTMTGCQAGTNADDAGFLSNPWGVSIGSGRLYVGDLGNHRISVFDISGAQPAFLHAFGRGVDDGTDVFQVCTTGSGCQSGEAFGTSGALNFPEGVELDAAGNLYVADSTNHRISVFNTGPNPSFKHAFGNDVNNGGGDFEVCTATCQAGTAANNAGSLFAPIAVATDELGNLYVAEDPISRVSVFSTAGPTFSHAFGIGVDSGSMTNFEFCTTVSMCTSGVNSVLAGGMRFPQGISSDSAGNVNVGSVDNERIEVFKGSFPPSFTQAFGWDVNPGGGSMLFETCVTAMPGCQVGSEGTGLGQFNAPRGSVVDCRGAVWTVEFSNDRVQRFGEPGTALPPCTVANPPVNNPPTTPANTPTVAPPTPKRCKKGQKLKKGKCVKKKRKGKK